MPWDDFWTNPLDWFDSTPQPQQNQPDLGMSDYFASYLPENFGDTPGISQLFGPMAFHDPELENNPPPALQELSDPIEMIRRRGLGAASVPARAMSEGISSLYPALYGDAGVDPLTGQPKAPGEISGQSLFPTPHEETTPYDIATQIPSMAAAAHEIDPYTGELIQKTGEQASNLIEQTYDPLNLALAGEGAGTVGKLANLAFTPQMAVNALQGVGRSADIGAEQGYTDPDFLASLLNPAASGLLAGLGAHGLAGDARGLLREGANYYRGRPENAAMPDQPLRIGMGEEFFDPAQAEFAQRETPLDTMPGVAQGPFNVPERVSGESIDRQPLDEPAQQAFKIRGPFRSREEAAASNPLEEIPFEQRAAAGPEQIPYSEPQDPGNIQEFGQASPGGELSFKPQISPRLIKEMSGKIYGSDLGKVIVKETLQNAIDSIPEGVRGKVDAHYDPDTRRVEVTDNGIGMLPEVATREFVNPGESYKPEGSAGGFGAAKMAIFGNADKIYSETRAKDPKTGNVIATIFDTTGDEWINALNSSNPEAVLRAQTKVMPPNTPTGTTVRIGIGKDVKVEGYEVRRYMENFQKTHRLSHDIGLFSGPEKTESYKVRPYGTATQGFEHVKTLTTESGTPMHVYADKPSGSTSMINVHILNKGIPQFTHNIYLDREANVPKEMVVDVHAPKGMDVASADYPFTVNREQLTTEANKVISNYIQGDLIKDAISSENQLYRDTVNNAPKIKGTDYKFVDATGKVPEHIVEQIASDPMYGKLVKDTAFFHDQVKQVIARMTGNPAFRGSQFHGFGFSPDWKAVNLPGHLFDLDAPNNVTLVGPWSAARDAHEVFNNLQDDRLVPLSHQESRKLLARMTGERMAGSTIHEVLHQGSRSHGEQMTSLLTEQIPHLIKFIDAFATKVEKHLAGKEEYAGIDTLLGHADKFNEIRGDIFQSVRARHTEGRIPAVSEGGTALGETKEPGRAEDLSISEPNLEEPRAVETTPGNIDDLESKKKSGFGKVTGKTVDAGLAHGYLNKRPNKVTTKELTSLTQALGRSQEYVNLLDYMKQVHDTVKSAMEKELPGTGDLLSTFTPEKGKAVEFGGGAVGELRGVTHPGAKPLIRYSPESIINEWMQDIVDRPELLDAAQKSPGGIVGDIRRRFLSTITHELIHAYNPAARHVGVTPEQYATYWHEGLQQKAPAPKGSGEWIFQTIWKAVVANDKMASAYDVVQKSGFGVSDAKLKNWVTKVGTIYSQEYRGGKAPVAQSPGKIQGGRNYAERNKPGGTGGGNKPPKTATGGSGKPPEPPRKPGRPRQPEDFGTASGKLVELLKQAEITRESQQALYFGVRKAQAAKLAKINAAKKYRGEKSVISQYKKALSGELPKEIFEPVRDKLTTKERNALFTAIKETSSLREFEKVRAAFALKKLLNRNYTQVPQRNEIGVLGKVFGQEFENALYETSQKVAGPGAKVASALSIPRALQSSFDMSAPFRQGLVLTVGRPIRAAGAAKEMALSYVSEVHAKKAEAEIANNPHFDKAQESGLEFTGGNYLTNREEAFMSTYADRIPGIGKYVVRPAERAFSAYLNKLRMDVFADGAKRIEKNAGGRDVSGELEALAKYINISTGRGSLGKHGEKIAPLLNSIFYSPRFQASRMRYIASLPSLAGPKGKTGFSGLPKGERIRALRDTLSTGAFGVGLASLAATTLGAKVETDPRSTDFAKIKIGNTRIDPWGGFQPYIRFMAQFITNERKLSTGRIKKLEDRPFPENRATLSYRFLESKLSPMASLIWNDLMQGKNAVGEPLNRGYGPKIGGKVYGLGAAYEKLYPLFLGDLYEAISDQGLWKGLGLAAPGWVGMGVSTYDPKKAKQKPKDIMQLPTDLISMYNRKIAPDLGDIAEP